MRKVSGLSLEKFELDVLLAGSKQCIPVVFAGSDVATKSINGLEQ